MNVRSLGCPALFKKWLRCIAQGANSSHCYGLCLRGRKRLIFRLHDFFRETNGALEIKSLARSLLWHPIDPREPHGYVAGGARRPHRVRALRAPDLLHRKRIGRLHGAAKQPRRPPPRVPRSKKLTSSSQAAGAECRASRCTGRGLRDQARSAFRCYQQPAAHRRFRKGHKHPPPRQVYPIF